MGAFATGACLMRAFIFGAGYSGKAFADLVRRDCDFLGGTTRSPAKAAALGRHGITPFLFDGISPSLEIIDALRRTTHLIASAGPTDHGDPVLSAVGHLIANDMPALRFIGYLSTVGVYGDHDGAVVTEESACRPSTERSIARLEAENTWLEIGRAVETPVAILRLSGIYGPGRNALANLAEGTARRIVKPGQVFNRIHVADIAGALKHLADDETGGVFNVSDDEPSPPQDVVAYAAQLMGVEPPPEIPFAEVELSPMARSFYGETKRVANAKLKATGYRFRYPDYRVALDAMWSDGTWRG